MKPQLFSLVFALVVGLLTSVWVLVQARADRFGPMWTVVDGTGAFPLVSAVLFFALERTAMAGTAHPHDDDGHGERRTWSSSEVESLSPHGAWTAGDSPLDLDDQTQEHELRMVPSHRAGVR